MSTSYGLQWSRVSGTAVGTVTLKDRDAVLQRVVFPATATGTIDIYDSASGTSATTFKLVNDTVDFPTTVDLGIQLRNGLTYVTSGTTNALIIYN